MTVGLPGTGIGGIFYILLSVYMPLFQLRRALNGGNKPHHLKMVASALFLSAAIILSLYGEAKLLLWFLERVMTFGDKAAGPVRFGHFVPASVVPALAAMPFLALLAIVVSIQFARLVLCLRGRRAARQMSCEVGRGGGAIGGNNVRGRNWNLD